MSPPHKGSMRLTFVNTTGQASLEPEEARKVRGHVTKTNFARRRELKGSSSASNSRPRRDRAIAQLHDEGQKALINRQTTPPTRPLYDERESMAHILLMSLREIMFPMKFGEARIDSEHLWKEVFLPEPSLMFCCVAAACRHKILESVTGGASRTIFYETRAMGLVSERLAAPDGYLEDGILGSVLSLAACQRLAGNHAVAAKHAEGLAQIIRLRRSNGINTPIWFREALLYNCFDINNELAYVKSLWPSICEALSTEESSHIVAMNSILQRMVVLQRNINLARESEMPADFVREEIELAVEQIKDAALSMSDHLPQSKGLAIGFAIFAQLSWLDEPQIGSLGLGSLARAMMKEMRKPGIRLFTYLHWSVWQLLLGNLAASDAETKAWFQGSMRAIAELAMGARPQDIMDYVLFLTVQPNPRILPSFEAAWYDIHKYD